MSKKKHQNESPVSPKKKKFYFTKFQDQWLKQTEYKTWLLKENEFTAKCRVCGKPFMVKHDGEKAVKAHSNSDNHRRLMLAQTSSQLLSNYMTPSRSIESLKSAIAELSAVYHSVRHQHSYISTDCGIKLYCKIFSDSSISQKIHCGRTKASSLTENILGPMAIELIIKDLRHSNTELFYSISSDASNKGNIKLFPLIVTYFVPEVGIKNKILDFYSDDYENSETVSNKILECLEKHTLSIEMVSSYSADNAPVNYGKSNSIYQKLCLKNKSIIKANCNCHVIHNAARFGCKILPYEVDILINKIYAEFSSSTVCVRELKICFEYFNLEYAEIMKSVPTRWLSLCKAVDRILETWPAVKLYFLQQGEEKCDKFIWRFIKSQEHELEDDLNFASVPEMYLYFVSHFLNFMCNSLLMLENEKVSAAELHDIMISLKVKLETRIRDRFFGAKVKDSLPKQTPNDQRKFTKVATDVYTRALEYISKYYNFDDSPFKHFSCLNLKTDLQFNSIIKVSEILNLKIDEDKAYDEVLAINKVLPRIRDSSNNVPELWVNIFRSSLEIKQIKILVSKVLCIPISNAFIERVFSIMGNVWRDDRNRMRTDLVKAELCTRVNIDMTCEEFLTYLKNPEQKSLLECSLKQTKYNFKKP